MRRQPLQRAACSPSCSCLQSQCRRYFARAVPAQTFQSTYSLCLVSPYRCTDVINNVMTSVCNHARREGFPTWVPVAVYYSTSEESPYFLFYLLYLVCSIHNHYNSK